MFQNHYNSVIQHNGVKPSWNSAHKGFNPQNSTQQDSIHGIQPSRINPQNSTQQDSTHRVQHSRINPQSSTQQDSTHRFQPSRIKPQSSTQQGQYTDFNTAGLTHRIQPSRINTQISTQEDLTQRIQPSRIQPTEFNPQSLTHAVFCTYYNLCFYFGREPHIKLSTTISHKTTTRNYLISAKDNTIIGQKIFFEVKIYSKTWYCSPICKRLKVSKYIALVFIGTLTVQNQKGFHMLLNMAKTFDKKIQNEIK